jgi:hypothetical protein
MKTTRKLFFRENSLPPHKFYAAVFHPTGLKIFKIFQPSGMKNGGEKNISILILMQFVSGANHWKPTELDYNSVDTWKVKYFCFILESKAKENCRRAIREGRDPIKRENKSFRICISCWRMGMPSCLILTSSGIKPHQKSTCCLGGEHFLIIPPFLLDPDRYIDPDQCLHTVIGKLLRIATKDPKTQVDPGITLKQRNEWVFTKEGMEAQIFSLLKNEEGKLDDQNTEDDQSDDVQNEDEQSEESVQSVKVDSLTAKNDTNM